MLKDKNVLLRGPCDIMALYFYLNHRNIELDSARQGKYLDKVWDTSNSIFLRQAAENKKIESHFVEPGFYPNEDLWNEKYKLVIISAISDGILGVYRNNTNGKEIAYGMHVYDATYNSGAYYRDENIYSGGIPNISESEYEDFSKTYTFLGRIDAKKCADNFKVFVDSLPKNINVCILLGPTFNSRFGEMNPSLKNNGVYIYQEINQAIVSIFSSYENVKLIDPSCFYVEPKHKYQMFYYNFASINHYPCKTYKLMARKIHKLYPKLVKVNYWRPFLRFVKRFFKAIFKPIR